MSTWIFVAVLILIAAMVVAVLVVATQAFLDTRAAGNNADRGHDGTPFRVVGGIRRGWTNYTWPGGELEVGDSGIVLSGPGFRIPGQWDAVSEVQMSRTIFGWGIRFRLSSERRPVTFWVRQRRYADKVVAAAHDHGVTIRAISRFSI